MIEPGSVSVVVQGGVGSLIFSHPKKNSLPRSLLRRLADSVTDLGRDDSVRLIALSSSGQGPFCAGASFDELLAVEDEQSAFEFFMGFAELILAMKKCPKFVLTRVQGKTVGGGVGIVAASDYVLAHEGASLKLSEFALGFGPFVIGPVVERKLGPSAFSAAAVDTDWRDSDWARANGLFTKTYATHEALDHEFLESAERLARRSTLAISELKRVFWEGTEHWDDLLPTRARISARLVLSDYTRAEIAKFKSARQ